MRGNRSEWTMAACVVNEGSDGATKISEGERRTGLATRARPVSSAAYSTLHRVCCAFGFAVGRSCRDADQLITGNVSRDC
jgi:hypothetical protein